MAQGKYIPKFQEGGYTGGGVWMGGRGMGSEKWNDIKSLALAIEKQQEQFAEGMGIRNLIDKGGDIVKAFFPGIGHALDLAWEETYGKSVDIGDEKEIEKYQTPWTGTGYAKEFKKMKEEGTPSLLESILGQGLEYVSSESFDKGEFGDWFSKLFSKGTDIPRDWREGGRVPKYKGGGSVYSNSDAPTIYGYFEKQGKTIGGSDTESLAQKLGRK